MQEKKRTEAEVVVTPEDTVEKAVASEMKKEDRDIEEILGDLDEDSK